jgi:nucleoid-associated protein YgaU
MKRLIGYSVTLLTAFALAGCATASKTQTTDAGSAHVAATSKISAKTAHIRKSFAGTITIEKGQTLWGIAKSESAYGKACNWPLLYKANKTDVQDPDLIYPGQVLKVPKDVPAVESDNACKASMKMGPYEPHTKPRTDINLDF